MFRIRTLLATGCCAVLVACAPVGDDAEALLPPLDPDHPRVQAVEQLAGALVERHVDVHHALSEVEFRAMVDRLARRAPGLSDAGFITELTRVAAAIGDGHTYLNWSEGRALPLRLTAFADGIFVTSTTADLAELVGARIVGIGGVPIDRALSLILPLVSADNDHQRVLRAPVYLSVVDFLEGVGLAEDGRVELELRQPKGTGQTVTVSPISFESWLHGLDVVPAELQQFLAADLANALSFGDMRPPTTDGPLYRRRHADSYWLKELPQDRALYVNYRYVRTGDPPVAEFARKIERIARAHRGWKVIVDIRENPGGSSELSHPIVEALRRLDTDREPGWLVVLISPKTFSAATGFLSRLELRTTAILVGTETGAGANHFGNVRTSGIESLGAQLKVSSRFHVWGLPEDRRSTTVPDVRIAERSSDFFSGQDVVLAAALQATPGDAGWEDPLPIDDLDGCYGYGPGRVLRVRCEASRCRLSVTGVLDTPARAQADGSVVGWHRDAAVVAFSSEAASYVSNGVTRELSRIAETALPFEELAFRGDFVALSRRLETEAESDPENARFSESALNRLGYEALWRDEVAGSIDIFRAAIALYPDSANLHDSLGEAQLAAGNRGAARESYEQALALDPESSSARRALQQLQGN